MNLGVGIPNGSDRADIESVVEFGMEVEALGFDSLWVMDRWLRPTAPVRMPGVAEPVRLPASSYRTVFDPLELLGYLAARTSTIFLGTSAVDVLYQTKAGIRRAARVADGLHPFRNDLAALHDDLTIYEHGVAAAGYSRQDLQVVLRTTAAAQAGERGSSLFTGPVEAWVEDLHALAGLGVDHVLVQLSGDASEILRTLAALQRFRDL